MQKRSNLVSMCTKIRKNAQNPKCLSFISPRPSHRLSFALNWYVLVLFVIYTHFFSYLITFSCVPVRIWQKETLRLTWNRSIYEKISTTSSLVDRYCLWIKLISLLIAPRWSSLVAVINSEYSLNIKIIFLRNSILIIKGMKILFIPQ